MSINNQTIVHAILSGAAARAEKESSPPPGLGSPLSPVYMMAMKEMSNDVLTAAHNSLTGFRTIGENCSAFEPFKKALICDARGNVQHMDETMLALTHILKERGILS